MIIAFGAATMFIVLTAQDWNFRYCGVSMSSAPSSIVRYFGVVPFEMTRISTTISPPTCLFPWRSTRGSLSAVISLPCTRCFDRLRLCVL